MTPDEQRHFDEYQRRLQPLLDRMLKAGYIVQHGNTKDILAAEFSQKGIALVEAVSSTDVALGGLTGQERADLWRYLEIVGEARHKRIPPNRN